MEVMLRIGGGAIGSDIIVEDMRKQTWRLKKEMVTQARVCECEGGNVGAGEEVGCSSKHRRVINDTFNHSSTCGG